MLSAARLLTILCLALPALTASAWAQADMRALLDAHNAYRARHCVPPLAWSQQIAASAQAWADRCVFNHDPNSELGENLAWGTALSGRESVSLWYEEISLYNYAAPGFGPAGHFTQVVWRDSRQIGCGVARCGGDVYWVCRYSPPGNVEGEFRANVPRVCK